MSSNFFTVRDGLGFTPGSEPSSPVNGDVYFDSTLSRLRGYQNGAWVDINGGASSSTFSTLDSLSKSFTVVDSGLKTFTYIDAVNNTLANDVWAATANLNSGKHYNIVSGTQNSAVSYGGQNAGVRSTVAELFNSSSWTTTGSMGTGRGGHGGCGVQNAALAFGGFNPASTVLSSAEKFNGSTWASTGSMSTTRGYVPSAGSQNNALAIGGYNGSTFATCEAFNGATWSATGSMNTATYDVFTCIGTGSAALRAGGFTGSNTATVEKFLNGAWTSTTNLLVATDSPGGCGVQNTAMIAGGYTPSTTNAVQKFNGNNWRYTGSMLTATFGATGGSASVALRAGAFDSLTACEKHFGQMPYKIRITFKGDTTEMYQNDTGILTVINDTGTLVTEVIPQYNGFANTQENIDLAFLGQLDQGDGIWISASSLVAAGGYGGGAGFQSAAIWAGGTNPSNASQVANTQLFNGSAWSGGSPINTAKRNLCSFGIQNSAIIAGGSAGGTYYNVTEKYNGITWTVLSATVPASLVLSGGSGVASAGLYVGGSDTGGNTSAASFLFNGSAWSTAASLAISRSENSTIGTQKNTLTIDGSNFPSPFANNFGQPEKYNGVFWSNSAKTNETSHTAGMAFGSANNGVVFSGRNVANSYLTSSERWNGISFVMAGNVLAGQDNSLGVGTSSAGLKAGGRNTDGATVTASSEKFITQVPNPTNPIIYGKLAYSLSASVTGV